MQRWRPLELLFAAGLIVLTIITLTVGYVRGNNSPYVRHIVDACRRADAVRKRTSQANGRGIKLSLPTGRKERQNA